MPDHQYWNTTIYVRDPSAGLWDSTVADPDPTLAVPAPVGTYKDIVFRHLDQVRAFPTGAQFLTALTGFGKRQVVAYIGTNVTNDNSCSGSGVGKKAIISRMGSGWSEARVELNYALAQWSTAHPGQNANQWLAGQLLQLQLHRWDPATTAATSPLNPNGVVPVNPEWPSMVAMLSNQIDGFRRGSLNVQMQEASGEAFALMVWALRDYLRDGKGSNCMIRYTPLKVQTSTGQRPAQVALFHELVHAYYEAQGGNLSNEDSANEWNGRYYELAAVGLPPFDTAPYSENMLRGLMGVAARTRY